MKQRALIASSRARLFGSVTPAHRRLVAQIIGELAISPKPDAKAAAAQIDAALSSSEKKAVIASNVAARAQMASLRKQNEALRAQEAAFRKHIMSERIAAGLPAPQTPMAQQGAIAPHPGWGNQSGQHSHKRSGHGMKTRTPDAGWYLVVAAQFGPHMHGMMGHGMRGMHGMGGPHGPHVPLGPGPVIPQH
jgi:hypothetical protein